MGSHQSGAESPPSACDHAAFDAAQDTVALLGCECALPGHVDLVNQHPEVVLGRAALNPFIPQPILIPGVAPTHVQDLALGLVEPRELPKTVLTA